MPRASKTEKADTPVKPTKPAKDQKPATTVKSSKNDKPAAGSRSVKVATSSRVRGREPPSPEALDELARDGAWEFLFVFTPVRFKGATGSPGRPIAIR